MATKEIPFQTRYAYKEPIEVPTGDPYDITRHVEFVKGVKTVIPDGKTNRYEKIQAHKEECMIENILARAAVDPNALNIRTGQYGDFTKMPKTLMEAQNMTIRINEEFMKLPADVRNKFDNNLEKYINGYGTIDWAKNLGIYEEPVTETKEVKADE